MQQPPVIPSVKLPDDPKAVREQVNDLRHRGRLNEAIELLERSLLHWPNEREELFGYLIFLTGRHCQLDQVRSVFLRMLAAGVEPAAYAYDELITAYARSGRTEEAQMYFDEMRAAGMKPDGYTSWCLIRAYAAAGQPDEAQKCFDQMCQAGMMPDELSYESLLIAYGRSGRLAEAEKVLRAVPYDQQTACMFNSLIGSSAWWRDERRILRLKEEMVTRGFEIDRYALGPMANYFQYRGAVDSDTFALRSQTADEWRRLKVLFSDALHDLSGIVGTVGARYHAAVKYLEKNEATKSLESLRHLGPAVQELGQMVERHRSLSDGLAEYKVFSVRTIIAEVVRMLQPRADHASVTIDYSNIDEASSNTYDMYGDAFMLRLALRNLVLNAIEACARLAVGAGSRRVVIGAIKVRDGNLPHDWLDIFVRDTGPGMPPVMRKQLFEHGFTTKPGRGLGLGLSLVQSVAEMHGGRVSLNETAEPDTEFVMRIPVAPRLREKSS